jgi:hypothetical protein
MVRIPHFQQQKFQILFDCCITLKGLGHQMKKFIKAYKIKTILYVHAPMVSRFLDSHVQEKIYIKFLLDSFKLTYFKN